jgi:hypothetical protein
LNPPIQAQGLNGKPFIKKAFNAGFSLMDIQFSTWYLIMRKPEAPSCLTAF